MSTLVTRIGVTSTGCTVYLFEGVGYWIAPSHMRVCQEDHRVRVFASNKRKARSISCHVSCNTFPLKAFEEAVTALSETLPYGMYLGRYRESWLGDSSTLISVVNEDERYKRMSVVIPRTLTLLKSTDIHIGYFRKDNKVQEKATYELALSITSTIQAFFKETYKKAIYDVLVYTKTNPLSNDTRRAYNVRKLNQRLLEQYGQFEHRLSGVVERTGQGDACRPGDTKTLLQAIAGTRRIHTSDNARQCR